MRKVACFLSILCLIICSCHKSPQELFVPVSSVTLNQEETDLIEGETLQLTATVLPADATYQHVSWSSSKSSVASVTDAGLVTALKEGYTVITASAGGKSASCHIHVRKYELNVVSVSIEQATLDLVKGSSEALVVETDPSDARGLTVVWTTSDESVATVDQLGRVTAVGGGSATITAEAGGKSDSCLVTVTVPLEEISIGVGEITLTVGDEMSLKAKVTPEDATCEPAQWSSSAPEVATVDNGLVIAVNEGTAIITAAVGDKSATCTVNVIRQIIHVTSIILDRETLSLKLGTSETLVATVMPSKSTDKSVVWASTNPGIAEVDGSGKVTAVSTGSVTVTATTTDGGLVAACEVTVYVEEIPTVPVTRITLDRSAMSLEPGHTGVIRATVWPSDATDATVTWATADQSVATVDDAGGVTAVEEGSTVITATAGDKSAFCTVTVSYGIIAVSSVSLDKTELNLIEGDTDNLIATVLPDNATDKTVGWSSNNTRVATVEAGVVTARGEGTAVITAVAGDKTSSCEVNVTKKVVHVVSVSLSRSDLYLAVGESEVIEATVLPDNATDQSIVWSSTNASIASVDAFGKVTAIAAGSVTIIAKANDGNVIAACEVSVYVSTIPITSVILDQTTLSLEPGQTTLLNATVNPSNATDPSITWATDDQSVASVDDAGNVMAVGEGSTVITATAGDKSAFCTVTVSYGIIAVSSISLDKTELNLIEGDTGNLVATVLPDNATDKTVGWSSNNTRVATVEAGVVTARGEGTAVITASSGEVSATCSVTVAKRIIHVSSISLNKENLSLAVGSSETLFATVLPDNATDKTLRWTSTNSSIVSVDSQGRVTAKASGTVTVSATTNDGGLVAACEVTAYVPTVPVTGITLDQTTLSLEKDQTAVLTATVTPSNATNSSVTWTSDNQAVATVTGGTVTAVSAGNATITAKAGDKTATCAVTVTEPETPPDPPGPDEPEVNPYTSNVTWTLGNKAYDQNSTTGENTAQSAVINNSSVDQLVKLGTSSANGTFTVNIPEGTSYLCFYALGWKGTTPKLSVSCTGASKAYDIKANNGVSQNPPYQITTTVEDSYYVFAIPSSSVTTVTISSEGRVILWGINSYSGDAPAGGNSGSDTPGGGDNPGGDDPGGDNPGGDPVFAGWMELPATDNPNLKFISHESSANPSGRNYSYYWDVSNLVAIWVAYPLNTAIIGSGERTNKWAYDPKLSQSEQPLLKSGYSNSKSKASSDGGKASYSRGHQIASADRLYYDDNVQTFYYTNMTPQTSSFNGGIWNNLENKVRAWSKQFDTLYVVTGCVVEGSTTYAYDNNNKRVTVPKAYYKALLGYDKSKSIGISSQTNGYTGIAFYFNHFDSYTSSAYMNESMTIDALEQKVGVDFFVNLPAAIGDDKANKVESTKDSWWK